MQTQTVVQQYGANLPDLIGMLALENSEHPTIKALVDIGRDHLQMCLPMPKHPELPVSTLDPVEVGGFTLAQHPPMAAMELLRGSVNIPALPEILLQLFNVVNSNRCSFGNVARVVRMDPALTATVLKVANSAAVGMQTPVSDLKQAVGLVGMDELSAMAMGSAYLSQFKMHPDAGVDLPLFWKHSFCVGVLAKNLARGLGLPNCERYFVAGLLHDVGRLALYANLPGFVDMVQSYCQQTGHSLQVVEKDACGFDHAAFGATLLHSWNLPLGIVEMVHRHHQPELAQKEYAEILYMADVLTTLIGHGPSTLAIVPELNPVPWDSAGVTPPLLYSLMEDITPSLERSFKVLGGLSNYWN
ncbi:MAG: HDOD domain-containing protein [Okeania sp. SIO3B3]|nr:HDOD domain-containing protein [Okeania sp. SIO3B3]